MELRNARVGSRGGFSLRHRLVAAAERYPGVAWSTVHVDIAHQGATYRDAMQRFAHFLACAGVNPFEETAEVFARRHRRRGLSAGQQQPIDVTGRRA